jgi:hypothetical protein
VAASDASAPNAPPTAPLQGGSAHAPSEGAAASAGDGAAASAGGGGALSRDLAEFLIEYSPFSLFPCYPT